MQNGKKVFYRRAVLKIFVLDRFHSAEDLDDIEPLKSG